MVGLLATVFLIGYFATARSSARSATDCRAAAHRARRRGVEPRHGGLGTRASVRASVDRARASSASARRATRRSRRRSSTTSPRPRRRTARSRFLRSPPRRLSPRLSRRRIARGTLGLARALSSSPAARASCSRSSVFSSGSPRARCSTEKATSSATCERLLAVDLYRQGVLGFCAYTAAIGAFSYWAPTFLFKRYGLAARTCELPLRRRSPSSPGAGDRHRRQVGDDVRRKDAREHAADDGRARDCARPAPGLRASAAPSARRSPSPASCVRRRHSSSCSRSSASSGCSSDVAGQRRRPPVRASRAARERDGACRSSRSTCSAISGRAARRAAHRPLPRSGSP